MAKPTTATKAQTNGLPTLGQLTILKLFEFLTAARWPTAVALVAWHCVPYLAGRDTRAVFFLAFKELGTHDATPWILTTGATMWAVIERQLRRSKTAYLSKRITTLELQVDPDRTSSGLPNTGETKRRRW
jgi:hypothetical protein